MGNINIVGPNEALIVSGGCCRSSAKTMVVGGWAWAWYFLTDVQKISLEVMTLNPKCENVETSEGVPITVTAIAQCKVMTEKDFLSIAAEQFLGKDVEHIKSVVLQTLEGHLRAVLGTMSVESIYRDRDQFATLVREVTTPDVGRMGIEVLSFTIKDVTDQVEYLSSLGKAKIAEVKKDASIGMAQAEKLAGMCESECERTAMEAKYSANSKIEDSHRLYLLEKASYDSEVNSKKAEAELAYQLQAAKLQQNIRFEEMQINVVERKKQILVEEKEIARKDKELEALVKLPADAEAYKVETIANAMKVQIVEAAKAEAEKIKLIGKAEACAIEAIGKAEARRMRLKAHAYKQFGEAAILSLTLEALPKVAAEITAPLAKTEEVLIMSGPSEVSGDVLRIGAQVSEGVKTITGFCMKKAAKEMFFSKKTAD